MADTFDQNYDWRAHIDIVDSSLSEQAIENIEKVDSEMLVHMDALQALTQRDLTKFGPVIVAEFTVGGGKFTLLRNKYGRPSREVVEPVPNLFAIAKSIAHAPLGIYACFSAYSTNPLNQGWREPLLNYRETIQTALSTLANVRSGYQIDDELKTLLVNRLNTVTGEFDGAAPVLNQSNVIAHIEGVLGALLSASIEFIDTQAFTLPLDQSPASVFQRWCNQDVFNEDINNGESDVNQKADDTLYKLIVQCQVIAATTQAYGIISLMKTWREEFTQNQWRKLYAVVEGEWVTREKNSIAQCILTEMADKEAALNDHLMIVTNLEGVDPALKFLARILEDRAGASMILTDHVQDRKDLSGQTDLLGPVMESVICPYKHG